MPSDQNVNATHIAKTLIITFFIGIVSFYLTDVIIDLVRTEAFTDPDYPALIEIPIALYLLSVFASLSYGAWGTWEKYFVVGAPMGLGVFLATFPYNVEIAGIGGLGIFFFMIIAVTTSTRISNNLINFDPILAFRGLASKIFLYFAVFAAVLFLLLTNTQILKIGEITGKFVSNQVQQIVNPTLEPDPGAFKVVSYLSGGRVSEDQAQQLFDQSFANQIQLSLTSGALGLEKQIEKQITQEITNQLAPYQNVIIPVLSVAVFGLIQLLAILSRIAFLASITAIFALGKKVGLFTVYTETVERQRLKF